MLAVLPVSIEYSISSTGCQISGQHLESCCFASTIDSPGGPKHCNSNGHLVLHVYDLTAEVKPAQPNCGACYIQHTEKQYTHIVCLMFNVRKCLFQKWHWYNYTIKHLDHETAKAAKLVVCSQTVYARCPQWWYKFRLLPLFEMFQTSSLKQGLEVKMIKKSNIIMGISVYQCQRSMVKYLHLKVSDLGTLTAL